MYLSIQVLFHVLCVIHRKYFICWLWMRSCTLTNLSRVLHIHVKKLLTFLECYQCCYLDTRCHIQWLKVLFSHNCCTALFQTISYWMHFQKYCLLLYEVLFLICQRLLSSCVVVRFEWGSFYFSNSRNKFSRLPFMLWLLEGSAQSIS